MGIQLLFAFFKDISSFFYDTSIFKDEKIFNYLGTILGVDIAGLILLCILWWKTDWLAKLLGVNTDDNALVIKTSNVGFLTVAIQIIGIFFIITSIPDFIGLAVYHIQMRDTFPGYDLSEYQIQETKQWVITSLTFILGLLLASGSKWLVKRIQGPKKLDNDTTEHK
jgi:hypothetical protein